ncbi:MAG: hypothetical protein NW241_05950 [Bacteroidia bacterium]|nr:hypothetical protein [Bacteroidia bacterium]
MSGPLLSPEEWAVLQDRRFMPLKASVWHKLEASMGLLRDALAAHLTESQAPDTWKRGSGKIQRGENYHTYAYRVLDMPAVAAPSGLLLFRTVLLWGHPIGWHLILGGTELERYRAGLPEACRRLDARYLLSRQPDPWRWEPDPDGQEPFPGACEALTQSLPFVKITRYEPLDAYVQLPELGLSVWQDFEAVLHAAGSGEPGLP